MIRFIFILLVFTSFQLLSQTAEQVASQAASMGITSEEDIIKELQKRGMTLEDARRMALIQGVDYDEYISKFIVKGDASATTLPTVSEIVFQIDTSQNTLGLISADIENTDSLNYFGYDIFLNNPFANKDYLVGNIDEGYILAPGDVYKRQILRSISLKNNLSYSWKSSCISITFYNKFRNIFIIINTLY